MFCNKRHYYECPICSRDSYHFKCSSCGADYKIGKGHSVPTVDEIRICGECDHDELAEKEVTR